MKLKRILVDNLFGIYKYQLDLIDSEQSHVTIIDAPNGMGKTTLLRMIQATFTGDFLYLDSIPFSEFTLCFENDQNITIMKKDPFVTILGNDGFEIRKTPTSYKVTLEKSLDNIVYIINGKEYKTILQEGVLPMYLRRVMRSVRDFRDRKSFSDFVQQNELNNENLFLRDDLLDALNEFSKDFNIYFIKTNRLYKKKEQEYVENSRIQRQSDNRNDMVSAVELYKEKIKNNILAVGKAFADKSEELDRTFPQRVLDIITGLNKEEMILSKDEIVKILTDLENKRFDYSELGLITEAGVSLVKIPEGEELTTETKIFLTTYIKDNIIKLEIYKEFAEKLRLLRNIVNERNQFSDKTMKFSSAEGIEFISKNGRTIPIEKLSSGEKNNFILFYELIFGCGDNSLILVDEPEISLHVAWQRQFIDELNEICQLKSLQGIVATHSPDIVGDNVDYMVDLEDLNYGKE